MANWFTNPASNSMLQNTFGNKFFQNKVQPVQSGTTNIRPTNLQALKNWQPWRAFMPQNMGGTFFTKPTGAASSALGYGTAAALPFGMAGLTHMVQKGLPQELKGKGGIFDTSTAAWGGMGAGAGIEPETDEILRANAIFSRNKNVPMEEQITETETIDPRGMRGISGEVGEYGDKPGEGFNEEMFYQQPGMWDKFKGMFQRPEAKQKEFDMYQQSKGPGGWGDIGGGYQGNIWGGNKLNVYDPASGQMVLRDKNFDSMFGSKSVEEMLGKKEAWARKRRAKGEDYLGEAMKSWLDELDRKKGGADVVPKGPRGDPRGPTPRDTTRGWSSPGYTTRGGFTGTGGSPGTGQRGHHGNFSQGGRVGYNRGGRVGILAAF